MRFFFLSLVFLILLTGCSSHGQVDQQPVIRKLHEGWVFSEAQKTNWLKATVPGVVHTDLLNHNKIPDPWYGLNEKEIQWVEEKNWQYQLDFEISEEELQNSNVSLIFEGLDTYATVILNGDTIGISNNMFRSREFAVRKLVKVGENKLTVLFESPVTKWQEYVKNAPVELPASSEMVDIRVSPYVRKAPYHFGWDWGPRYVTMGIWRPVYLKFYNTAVLNDVQVHQKTLSDSLAELEIAVSVRSFEKKEYSVVTGAKSILLPNFIGDTTIRYTISIENPKLWWPHEWGDQYMYSVPVRLKQDHFLLDEKTRKIGLRTIELVQEEDDLGRSFYFKVNGQKFFVRGANYIPQSNFLPSVRSTQYDSLIADAKAVNINMIRIWGGGIYENDYFYELCDENGILVWQDFMFAGTMYPGDSAFLSNIKEEVKENVLRLRNHPSIAHWNGNNEIEVAWHQWGWQRKFNYSKSDSTFLYHNYLKLFDTLIPSVISQYDPQRSYTPTSPERSYTKLKKIKSGTVHYWGVWHAGHPFEKYRQYLGRFMAEWGFQSFPDMETIKTFSSEKDWALDSEVMKWHQKSPPGNGLIEKQGLQYFDKPKDFEEFVRFSQHTQALAMRVAIDAHRLAEYNGGTLYWQLNDCWPGPSWSTRDVFGRWKESHKQLQWIYAPVAVIPKVENGELQFVGVNDLNKTQKLTLRIVKQDTKKNHVIHDSIVEITPNQRVPFFSIADNRKIKELKKGKHTYLIELTDSSNTLKFSRVIDKYDVLTY